MKTTQAALAADRGSSVPHTFRTLTLIVCVGLGLLFTVFGLLKIILPPPEYARQALGDARWTHVVLGLVELGGGLFLLWPRTVPLGAGLMAIFLSTLLTLSLLHGNRSPALLIPLVVLGCVVVIGYLRHPGRLAASRMRSVLDQYADQQLRKERGQRTA